MEDSIKSKTQLKKEADDIQQFGIEISNLPNHKIKIMIEHSFEISFHFLGCTD